MCSFVALPRLHIFLLARDCDKNCVLTYHMIAKVREIPIHAQQDYKFHYDIPFTFVCNSISLIPFNSIQSQLLFDESCHKIDQVIRELSIKILT